MVDRCIVDSVDNISAPGDGGAALAAAPLVAQQHGEAAGARVIALLQTVHRDTDVVPAVANINIIT